MEFKHLGHIFCIAFHSGGSFEFTAFAEELPRQIPVECVCMALWPTDNHLQGKVLLLGTGLDASENLYCRVG
jgi:hypothetical protein